MPRRLKTIDVKRDTSGQVIEQHKSFSVKAANSEEFYMTYLSFMQHILKIKSAIDIQVLTKFCLIMEYDTNQVFLTSKRRKEICEELSISNPNLSHSLKRLRENGLVTGEEGTYEINPKVVWKGSNDTRDKMLRENKVELLIKFQADVNKNS